MGDTEGDRNNILSQAKKDKKLHEQFMNELQDKYDKLERKYRKIMGDRTDLLSDRDNLASKCSSLEQIIRENKEQDTSTLREELLDAKDAMNKLQQNYDNLRLQNNKLDDEYQLLSEKYNLEKDSFKRAVEKFQIDKHFEDNDAVQSGDN